MTMVSTKQKIQYALVTLMDENGTKGTELAEAIGVKKQSVSGWRRGETSMDVDNMIAVCDYYGITMDEFVGRGTKAAKSEETRLVELYRALGDDDRRNRLFRVSRIVPRWDKIAGHAKLCPNVLQSGTDYFAIFGTNPGTTPNKKKAPRSRSHGALSCYCSMCASHASIVIVSIGIPSITER